MLVAGQVFPAKPATDENKTNRGFEKEIPLEMDSKHEKKKKQ